MNGPATIDRPDGTRRVFMANTYTSLHYHIVFSTKNREPWLVRTKESRIWEYLGGIARANGMKALQVGGYDDHIHLLLAVPAVMSLSKAVQLIKGASSRWIHETDNDMTAFAWQDGYGAFTLGVSQIADTVRYIEGQREHHRSKTFQEEYAHFLQKHGVEYDERYIWG
jgi:putative transposase